MSVGRSSRSQPTTTDYWKGSWQVRETMFMDPKESMIWGVADELFREKGKIPTIDEVRVKAGVSQAAALGVMRAYRDHQRKQLQTVNTTLPIELSDEVAVFGAKVWDTAIKMANQSLLAAKASFDAERDENTCLSNELAVDFDREQAVNRHLRHELEDRDAQISHLTEENNDYDMKLKLALANEGAQNQIYSVAVSRCAQLEAALAEERIRSSREIERAAQCAGQLEATRLHLIETKEELRSLRLRNGALDL